MILNKTAKDKLVFVYTTCADLAEAKHLAYAGVEERLAVCVDFWPIESVYPWQGVVQHVVQYMVMFTTKKELLEKLSSFIGGLHSYTVPMIAVCETSFTNSSYAVWAEKVLDSNTQYISQEEAELKAINDAEDGYHPGNLN